MKFRYISPLFLSLIAAFASPAIAAPSGGPYGPIAQSYEIPEANSIYYVSPDGDADARGQSPNSPTTIEAAIAKVETGDAIILRGGAYRVGSLRLSQGVTIQPFEDERPVFKGTRIASEWTDSGEGRWQTYWPTLFPATPADWWRQERHVEETPLHRFNNDMVFIDGKLLLSVGSPQELDENSYYIDYENGTVTIAQDPSDKTVEITAHNSALVRTMRSAHGKPNDGIGPTLRGITFTQYARLALEIEGVEPAAYMPPENFGKEIVGATLEHLTISHCSRVAGYFRGDNLTIRHCLVSDCGTEGIYVINSADVLIEKTIVTRTNSAEKFSGYYASAVKIFNQSYNVVCRDNLIIDNPHASGIWYDVGNVDGLVVDNWFQNTNDGFFFEISKSAICVGNVFVDCSPGIRVLNSSGVRAYQNTFYNSRAEIIRTPRSHQAGDHFGWHASAGPDVDERHSHVFVNNLLAADAQFDEPLLFFFQTEDLSEKLTEPQVDELDGNVYARQFSGEPTPYALLSPTPSGEHTADIDSPAALHDLYSNFEANSEYFPSYYGPLFQSPRLGHFELSQDFPASDAGIKLPQDVLEVFSDSESLPFPGAYPPES